MNKIKRLLSVLLATLLLLLHGCNAGRDAEDHTKY